MPKQGGGRKPKVPQQHKDLLQAWEARGSVHFDRQFHDISEDLINSTLKEVDNLKRNIVSQTEGRVSTSLGLKACTKLVLHLLMKQDSFYYLQVTIHLQRTSNNTWKPNIKAPLFRYKVSKK